jgi:hypothetical protein
VTSREHAGAQNARSRVPATASRVAAASAPRIPRRGRRAAARGGTTLDRWTKNVLRCVPGGEERLAGE